MKYEYKTTSGEIQWSPQALHVESVPDPEPPGEDRGLPYRPAWEMVGSVVTEVRSSVSTVLWFWRREVP